MSSLGVVFYKFSDFILFLSFIFFMLGILFLYDDFRLRVIPFFKKISFFNLFVRLGHNFGYSKICFLLLVLLLLFNGFISNLSVTKSYVASIKSAEESKQVDDRIKLNSSKIGVDYAVFKSWIPVLKKIGFDVSKNAIASYDVSDKNNKVYILGYNSNLGLKTFDMHVDKDNRIKLIQSTGTGKDFYDKKYLLYENGHVISTLDCFNLTSFSLFETVAKKLVTECLKSPYSAQFSDFYSWSWIVNPEYVTVIGDVDAQNSFGAMIRSKFKIIFKKPYQNANEYDSKYIRVYLDGRLVGKFGE